MDRLLKASQKLADFIQNELDIPYSFNILDELHSAENDHTRILMSLLKYKYRGNYVILKLFIEWLSERNSSVSEISEKIDKPRFGVLKEYIDGFIEEKKSYAIVIENKIDDAKDQDEQIERYVNLMIDGHGFEKSNIFVIYLTNDGSKKINDVSLTDNAIERLDYKNKNEPGRFIEANYENDILPWLREKIIPAMLELKEEFLITGIKQYVDYLEGRFEKRKIEENKRMAIDSKACELLKLENLSGYELVTKINEIKDEIYNSLDRIQISTRKQIIKNFEKISKEYFDFTNNELTDTQDEKGNGGYYQLSKNNWQKAVHFEWVVMTYELLCKGNEYTLHLHTEDDCSSLKDKLWKDDKFKKEWEKIEDREDIECDKGEDDSDVFWITIQTKKPFFELSVQKQRDFLESSYSLIEPFCKIIDSYYPKNFAHIKDDDNYNVVGRKLKYRNFDVYFYLYGLDGIYGIEIKKNKNTDKNILETLIKKIKDKVSNNTKFDAIKNDRNWCWTTANLPGDFAKHSNKERFKIINDKFEEIQKAISK